MKQLALFEEFAAPASKRFAIQQHAALRRETEERAGDSRRLDRDFKAKAKLASGEATCCLGWYPRSAGWSRCVNCQKPLAYS